MSRNVDKPNLQRFQSTRKDDPGPKETPAKTDVGPARSGDQVEANFDAPLLPHLEKLEAELESLAGLVKAIDQRIDERARSASAAAVQASSDAALKLAAIALRSTHKDTARRKDQALERNLCKVTSVRGVPKRRTQLDRKLDGLLVRGRSPGVMAVIARSGLWNTLAHQDNSGLPVLGLRQYARAGAHPDARPASLFDHNFYLKRYADVARQPLSPLAHYLMSGDAEGRQPHPLFDNAWYRGWHQDEIQRTGLTSLQHFLREGAARGLDPHPLFNTRHYLSQVTGYDGTNPLIHYLREGWRKGVDPHPLFDSQWYQSQHPIAIADDIAPLLHYVTRGHLLGYDPHPLFSQRWYLSVNKDVDQSGKEPLGHFWQRGQADRRDPHPMFSITHYLTQAPELLVTGRNALEHFVSEGVWQGLSPNPSYAFNEALKTWDPAKYANPFISWVQTHGHAPHGGTTTAQLPPFENTSATGSTSQILFQQLYQGARDATQADLSNPLMYEQLSRELREAQSDRISALDLHRPSMVSINEGDFGKAAAKLRFKTPARVAVSIVIPVFNNLKYTLECLTALYLAGGLENAEVIVVDDASTDRSEEVLSTIQGLKYIRNVENLGFLLTCNGAAKQAEGDVLIFLNNDTQVQADWLAPLLVALANEENAGIVAPKLLFPNGRLQEAGATIEPEGHAQLIGVFDDPDAARYNYMREVDYVSGACLALPRKTFEELGGFDTTFAPAYCEDADLCFRVRKSGKRILYVPKSLVIHHLSVTSNSVEPTYKTRLAVRNQQRFVERWSEELEAANRVRIIAFYLPQFHALPENDRWWGAGFTEWTNVTRALPNFEGHYQPHRPGELGYYNLDDPSVMDRQSELARTYGIDGFCYYYYWFSGRRVMEKPLNRLLETGKPDLPFMLCWANENWTRTWDGQEKDVLLEQKHQPEDPLEFIKDVAPLLRMDSYIRVNGKPMLAIYRPSLIPGIKRVAEIWRRYARETGIGELYLCFVETFENARTHPDPAKIGFDASIEFPPSNCGCPRQMPGIMFNPNYTGVVNDYLEMVRTYAREPVPGHTRFRGVMPSWDNTARRQNESYVFNDASPGAFQAWLEYAFAETRRQNFGDERIVFVNAWNEWAEGAHLEPDVQFGRGWLEAVRNAIESQRLIRKP